MTLFEAEIPRQNPQWQRKQNKWMEAESRLGQYIYKYIRFMCVESGGSERDQRIGWILGILIKNILSGTICYVLSIAYAVRRTYNSVLAMGAPACFGWCFSKLVIYMLRSQIMNGLISNHFPITIFEFIQIELNVTRSIRSTLNVRIIINLRHPAVRTQ